MVEVYLLHDFFSSCLCYLLRAICVLDEGLNQFIDSDDSISVGIDQMKAAYHRILVDRYDEVYHED